MAIELEESGEHVDHDCGVLAVRRFSLRAYSIFLKLAPTMF